MENLSINNEKGYLLSCLRISSVFGRTFNAGLKRLLKYIMVIRDHARLVDVGGLIGGCSDRFPLSGMCTLC
jgi:hypothetical protein